MEVTRVGGPVRKAEEEAPVQLDPETEAKEAFALFDKDGGGTITREEFESVYKALGKNDRNVDKEISDLMKVMDADGNGQISFEEFKRVMLDRENDEEATIRSAFKMFDRDQTGYISAAEIRDVLVNLGDKLTNEEVDEMMRNAEVGGDCMVSYSEFKQMLLGP